MDILHLLPFDRRSGYFTFIREHGREETERKILIARQPDGRDVVPTPPLAAFLFFYMPLTGAGTNLETHVCAGEPRRLVRFLDKDPTNSTVVSRPGRAPGSA